jgi:hypothetical protein
VTAFLLCLAVLTQQSDSLDTAEDGLNFGLLFHSTASADLNEGLKDLSADSLTVFPTASYRGDIVTLGGKTAVNYSADSTVSKFDPLSAQAFFRWPGSPWLETGVSMGLINPFIPGLNQPVREWNSYEVFDSISVTLKAGGLLGFQGFWHETGDSLSWYGVKSPWLGFGSVVWNGITENSSRLETVSGFIDLKRVQPWFLFVSENSRWTYTTELRGWTPVNKNTVSMEVVPVVSLGEDSETVGVTALISGKNRAVSGFFKTEKELEDSSNPTVAAGLNVLSQAGIDWAVTAEFDRFEVFHGVLSGFYRMSPAGCGGRIEMFDDSLRVTATALYSPVDGVSTELSVMSDLNANSPQPGCLLQVFGAGNDFTGKVSVEWKQGLTVLGMEVSAWID